MLERIFGTNGLDQIISREMDLTTRKRAAVVALAFAREAAGGALVNGEAVQELTAVTRLVEETSASDRAIGLVRGQRAAAISAENRAAANRLRSQAKEKQGELNTLNAKVAKLLADIGKLQAVEYDQAGIFVAANGPERSDGLTIQIRELNERAESLESAVVPKSGYFDADAVTDDAEVIAGVLRHRSEVPAAEAVASWMVSCADSDRVPGRTFGNAARRVRIVWESGTIDTSASYVFVPSLSRKATGVMRSDGTVNQGPSEFFDVATGEFRAAA